MKHSMSYKKMKFAAAIALVSMFAVGNAQAYLVDLSAPTGQTSDQTAPVLSSNSALLTATSTVSYDVSNLVSFDWYFDALDYLPYNDSSSFMEIGGAATLLADVAAVGNYGNSGWQTYNFAGPWGYSGRITFGVYNVLDNVLDSTLEIQSANQIPEPGFLALFGLGLVSMGIARRKARV